MPWRGCPRDVRKTSSGKRCELTSEDGIRILGMEQQVQSPGRKGSWGYRGPKGGLRGEAGVAGTGRQLWEEPGGAEPHEAGGHVKGSASSIGIRCIVNTS